MMAKGLALVSGGLDSVTLLYGYQADIQYVLNFEYGAKHNIQESQWAKYHAESLGKTYLKIDLKFIADLFSSDLLKSGGEIPDGHYSDLSMKSTVVPFRNGIMLAVATGLCESLGGNSVYIANHMGDHAIYPDCRQSFIEPFAEAMHQGTYGQIKLKAPFTGMSKREIAERGKDLNIDYSKTWSCYKGDEIHCGSCGTCVERKEALSGFDPTSYKF